MISSHFTKTRLKNVNKEKVIQLLTHTLVKRHMPLSSVHFDDKEYDAFIRAKEETWKKHNFGPEGYFVDDVFIGWAGLQPDEGDDFEIAIVLMPEQWGYGIQIYKEVVDFAFNSLNLKSVVIYFPPSRTRIKGIFKAGFVHDGETIIEGNRLMRYRLFNEND